MGDSVQRQGGRAGVPPLRILVADEFPLLRRGVRSFLGASEAVEVVCEAARGRDAIRLASETVVDVAIVELRLSDMGGAEMIRRLRKHDPPPGVLVYSGHGDPASIQEALDAGAGGYLFKETEPTELLEAIEAVALGERYLCERAGAILSAGEQRATTAASRLELLSPREREVLKLIAEGWSNRRIAEHLDIGVRTVGTHRERTMRKLGVHNTAGLTRRAIAMGLVAP